VWNLVNGRLSNTTVTSSVFNDYILNSYIFRPILAIFNIIERYFIYREFFIKNHLNDESNMAPNKITLASRRRNNATPSCVT